MKHVDIDVYNFYENDPDFREYCHKQMEVYRKKLTDVLISPITEEYYKSLQPGGCNYKEARL